MLKSQVYILMYVSVGVLGGRSVQIGGYQLSNGVLSFEERVQNV